MRKFMLTFGAAMMFVTAASVAFYLALSFIAWSFLDFGWIGVRVWIVVAALFSAGVAKEICDAD